MSLCFFVRLLLQLVIIDNVATAKEPTVCQGRKPLPKGLYHFSEQSNGENFDKNDDLKAELENVQFVKGIDGVENTAVAFSGDTSSKIDIAGGYQLDTKWDTTILFNIFPIGKSGPILLFRKERGVQIHQVDYGDPRMSAINVLYMKRNIRYTVPIERRVLERNKWNQIAARYVYETGITTLFKNGVNIGSVSNGKSMVATQKPILIGVSKRKRKAFEGYMSCFQIYDVALSEEEIQRIQYNCRSTSDILKGSFIEENLKADYATEGDIVPFGINTKAEKYVQRDLSILADYGDGNRTETNITGISHLFKIPGSYNVSFEVNVGCADGKYTMKHPIKVFKVLTPIEDLALGVTEMAFGNATNFLLYVSKGDEFVCDWMFGDETPNITTSWSDFKSKHTVSHLYERMGDFEGNVECANGISRKAKKFHVVIQERISGVKIDPVPPKSVNQSFKIPWHIEKGSNLMILVTIFMNDLLLMNHSLRNQGLEGEINVSSTFFQEKQGNFKIWFTVKNDVTNPIVVTINVEIYNFMKPFQLYSDANTIEVNETMKFYIKGEKNIKLNNFPLYDWDFGDGYSKKGLTDNRTEHQFINYGDFKVNLKGYNPIDSVSSYVDVHVLRPVLELQNLNCKSKVTHFGFKTDIDCTLEEGSDFVCVVDWGRQELTSHNYLDLKYYVGMSFAKTHLQNLKPHFKYLFAKPGEYLVSVNCSNRINSVVSETGVIVQVPITGLEIKPVEPVTMGDKFEVIWTKTGGTNITYDIYLQGKKLINSNMYKPESIIINKDVYKDIGVYNFTVRAANLISEIAASSQIIIENKIREVSIRTNLTKNEAEIYENIKFDIIVSERCYPKYEIDLGDGQSSGKSSFIHMYKNYGVYTISASAYNNVSDGFKESMITIHKPVVRLGTITLDTPPANVTDTIELTAILSKGSDFSCFISYGDGHTFQTEKLHDNYYVDTKDDKDFENIKVKFRHAYVHAKKYEILLNCSNRLSFTSISKEISVYKPVVSFQIDVKPFNELREEVVFKLTDENERNKANHQYEVDFGDSTDLLTTTDNILKHRYTKYGDVKIKITAINPVSRVKISKKFHMLKPVLPLKELTLKTTPNNITTPTVLQIRIKEGSDINCSIKWTAQKTQIIERKDSIYYGGGISNKFFNTKIEANHTYVKEGRHRIDVTCWNRLNELTAFLNAIVLVPIKGLVLVPTQPQEFGNYFYIECKIEGGSDLNLHLEWNDGQRIPSVKPARFLITDKIYSKTGINKFKVVASNLVTKALTIHGEVIIDKKILSVDVSIPKKEFEVNETISLFISTEVGSNKIYTASMQGNVLTESMKPELAFSFQKYGVFDIMVTAKNNISTVTKSIKVKIMKPVIRIKGLNMIISSISNVSVPIPIKLTLQEGSDIKCHVTYGDGEETYLSAERVDYYTTPALRNKDLYKNIELSLSHTFSKKGDYKVVATCKNRLSILKNISTASIYLPIKPFEIACDQTPAEINDELTFNLQGIEEDAEPTFLIDYGDKTGSFKTNSMSFTHKYTTYGTFTVKVKAWNPSSIMRASMEVVIMKPVLDLVSLSVDVKPANLTFATSITVMLQKGSDFQCRFNKMGEPAFLNSSVLFPFYQNSSLDEKPFTNIQKQFYYVFKEIGTHHFSAQCFNRKRHLRTQATAIVQIPIEGLKVEDVEIQKVGNSFDIYWSVTKGSHIQFKPTWNNNQVPFKSNDKKHWVHISEEQYNGDGYYTFQLVASNQVSGPFFKTMTVVIEHEIKDLELSAAYSTIEVNQTLVVKALMTAGTYPLFHFTKGDGSKGIMTRKDYVDFDYIINNQYEIKVEARNNVSSATASLKIEVLKPVVLIKGLVLKMPDIYSVHENFTIGYELEQGSDFYCYLDFGDGKGAPLHVTKTEYYQNGPALANVNKFKNLKYGYKHEYNESKTYTVKVICTNRLSSEQAEKDIQILIPTGTVRIHHVEPQRLGGDFKLQFMSAGSNISYRIKFLGETYETDEQMYELKAKTVGIHKITVESFNSFSVPTSSDIYVIIEKSIADFSIISPTANQKIEVGDEFKICYNLKQGTNPKFDVSTGDDNIEKTDLKCVNHKYELLDYFKSGSSEMSLKISVHAHNNVSNVTLKVPIKLQKPVVKLIPSNLTCVVAQTATISTLDLETKEGSDFICTLIVPSQNLNMPEERELLYNLNGNTDMSGYRNIIKEYNITFADAGFYAVHVDCENRLSDFKLKTTCEVQDAIEGLTLNIPKNVYEVNESVSVEAIIKSGSHPDFHFTKDIGSVPIITTENKVSYDYILQGTYTVAVRANNKISKAFAAQNITVLKPVLEITEIQIILDEAIKVSENVTVHLKIKQGSDLTCKVDFGDGYVERLDTVKSNYYENGPLLDISEFQNMIYNFSHKYDMPKTYSIHAECSNRRYKKETVEMIYMQMQINSVAIHAVPPQKIGADFNVAFVAYGTNITYKVNFLDETLTIPAHNQNEQNITLTAKKVGIHKLKITAVNLVSEAVHHSIDVIIENPISGLEIVSPGNETTLEVGERMSLCYKVKGGSNPHYKVEFGDENMKKIIDSCADHIYALFDYFKSGAAQRNITATVTAYNNVSSLISIVHLVVFKPVFKLESESLTCKVSETSEDSYLDLQISKGSDFTCAWSEQSHDIHVQEEREYIYYKNGLLDETLYQNINKVMNLTFDTPGSHIVEVKCQNRISEMIMRTYCVVQDPIKDLKIEVLDKSFEVNETVALEAVINSGTNTTYEFIKGDGTPPEIIIGNSIDYRYILHGDYKITARAMNKISKATATRSVTIIKPVLKISKVTLKFDDVVRIRDNVTVIVEIEEGSDFQCIVDFGDTTQKFLDLQKTEYYEDGPQMAVLDDFRGMTYSFEHVYEVAESYSVHVNCSNRLSWKSAVKRINVQISVGQLQIVPVLPQKFMANFNLTFFAPGTNITYEIEFMGQKHLLSSPDNLPKSLFLDATQVGVHLVSIKATNLLDKSVFNEIRVIVEKPITGLQITKPLPGSEFEVNETFTICTKIKEGSNPKYTFLPMNNISLESEETCVDYSYKVLDVFATGVPDAKLKILVKGYNNVSSVNSTVEILLHKPVIKLKKPTLKCSVSETNKFSMLTLNIEEGSDFTCTVKENVQGINIKKAKDFIYYKDKKLDMIGYRNITEVEKVSFNHAGSYEVHYECKNRLSEFLITTLCLVQDSIHDILLNEIKIQAISLPFNLSWTISSGTNVSYSVYLNNGEIKTKAPHNTHIVIPPNTVKIPKTYKGLIVASNLVTQNYTKPFEITYERILRAFNISIEFMTQRQVRRTGYGDVGFYYPTDTKLVFGLNKISDNYDYYMTVNGDKVRAGYDSKTHEYVNTFKTAGTKEVFYFAENNVSSVSGSRKFQVLEPIGEVELLSESPGAMDVPLKFTIRAPKKGNESCFVLHTGDGVSYHFTTEDGNCDLFNKSVGNFSGIFYKNETEFILEHIYITHGEFTAHLEAINMVSSAKASNSFLVSEVDCDFPIVFIENLGNSTFYPSRLMKSDKMTVYIDVEITCGHTSKTKYEWSIIKIDQDTNKRYPVKLDNSSYAFDPYTQKDFIIKKRAMNYGLYIVKVKVSMDSYKTRKFFTYARGFLHVYPSPLESIIDGGALLRRGWGRLLKFQGEKSYDPDTERGDLSGMKFHWVCINVMEKLPKRIVKDHVIPPYLDVVLEPKPYDPEVIGDGGCFADGNYTFETPGSRLDLNTMNMKENQTYAIFLFLKKDTRTSIAFQVLELVEGDPPELGIECSQNCKPKINPSGKLALMGTCVGNICRGNIAYEWFVFRAKTQAKKDKKIEWELDKEVMRKVDQYRRELVFVVKKYILTPGRLYRFTLTGGVPGGKKGLAQRNGMTNTPPVGGECSTNDTMGEAMKTSFKFSCHGWDDEDRPLRYEYVYFNEQGSESLFYFGVAEFSAGKLPLGSEKTNYTIQMEIRIIDAYDATTKLNLSVQVIPPVLTEDELIAVLLNMTEGENNELQQVVNSGDMQAISKLLNSAASVLNQKSNDATERDLQRRRLLKDLSQNGTLHINGSISFTNGTTLHQNGSISFENGTVAHENGSIAYPHGCIMHQNGSISFHNGTTIHDNETAVFSNGTIMMINGTMLHPNGTFENGTWTFNDTSYCNGTYIDSSLFNMSKLFNVKELTKEQKRKRDRKKIRTALIEALTNHQSTSLEATRQIADVLGTLTKSKGEVTPESQGKSAKSIMGMADQLSGASSDKEGPGSDVIESAAGSMAAGFGNLLGAAAGTAKPKIPKKRTTTEAPKTTVSMKKLEEMFSGMFSDYLDDEDDDEFQETNPTKLHARDTVANVFSSASKVSGSITGKKLPGEEPTAIDSPSMAIMSGQADPDKMDAPICSAKGGGFKMPAKAAKMFQPKDNTTKPEPVGQQMMVLNDNPFSWDPHGGVSGSVTSISLSAPGGSALDVNGTAEPMEITMPRESTPDPPTEVSFPPYTQRLVYHKVNIAENNTALSAHIIPIGIERVFNYSANTTDFNNMTASNSSYNFTLDNLILAVYVRRTYRPTKRMHDWKFILPIEDNSTADACNPPPPEAPYTVFVSDEFLSAGDYFIGVSVLLPPGVNEEALKGIELNYTVRVFTSQCKYWDDASNKWKTDGCHVGPKTDLTKTHCLCTHLTSFGGGLLTAPTPIDFSKVFDGFKNMFASGNVTVFFSIIALFGLYIILAIYCRRRDVANNLQLGVTPILNPRFPEANYQYELTVLTNRGSASSTTANVFCQIFGTEGNSGPVILKDEDRQLFLPSATNSFLILVPECLGDIKYIRLWHDNSGDSPSWNFQKLILRDVQTDKQLGIFLGSWLALDEGELEIDRIIKPATEEELENFNLKFKEKLAADFGEAHIWFSIFLCPASSRFSSLQRLSCCLCILTLTMVSSAMFYGAGPETASDDANAIVIGPVIISLKMIIIGIESSLVVVPPSILIIMLFSKAKRRHAITIESILERALNKRDKRKNQREVEENYRICCFKKSRKRLIDISSDEEYGKEENESDEEKSEDEESGDGEWGYYQSSDQTDPDITCSSSEFDYLTPSDIEDPLLPIEELEEFDDLAQKKWEESKKKKKGIQAKIMGLYDKVVNKKKNLTPEQEAELREKERIAWEKAVNGSFPWWTIYPGWVLVFLTSTSSALFTLFYSMMWGKHKSDEWITTLFLSFFQDTFFSKPIKIVTLAVLFALVVKTGNEEEEEPRMAAEPLEEGDEPVTTGLEDMNSEDFVQVVKPMSRKKIAALREQKLTQKKMGEILRSLAFFIFYISLLFLVSAGNRDRFAYSQYEQIKKLLADGGSPMNSNSTEMYPLSGVSDIPTFWKYIKGSFIPTMYFHHWYNGKEFNYSGYTYLRETKRLGITRMRQQRLKYQDGCDIYRKELNYTFECQPAYSIMNRDTNWYLPGWHNGTKRPKGAKMKGRISPWKFANGKESRIRVPIIATFNSYLGGGYLGELGTHYNYSEMLADYMHKYEWIGKYTRSVILEFTMYNANLNLISVGVIMFEFLNFGGVWPRFEVYVSRMYRVLVLEHKILLAFDIIFFIYIFYSFFRELKEMKQQKKEYFKSVQNWFDLIIILLGFCILVAYVMRSLSLSNKIATYVQDPSQFISFYQNAMLQETTAYIISIVDFIAIIKLVTFLRFNRNFLTLTETIRRAAVHVSWFMIYTSLMVFGFVLSLTLMLGTQCYNYSGVKRSMFSSYLLLLGVFEWSDFLTNDPLGPIMFIMFCLIMTFILMNIFLTILMDVYSEVQNDEELSKLEFHLVEYLFNRVVSAFGIAKKPEDEEEEDERIKVKKDPFLHRVNKVTRSIEFRKIPKARKIIDRLYADEMIEDLELLSLQLMKYPDEFFRLIPCGHKMRAQTLLRRGQLDFDGYQKFMKIRSRLHSDISSSDDDDDDDNDDVFDDELDQEILQKYFAGEKELAQYNTGKYYGNDESDDNNEGVLLDDVHIDKMNGSFSNAALELALPTSQRMRTNDKYGTDYGISNNAYQDEYYGQAHAQDYGVVNMQYEDMNRSFVLPQETGNLGRYDQQYMYDGRMPLPSPRGQYAINIASDSSSTDTENDNSQRSLRRSKSRKRYRGLTGNFKQMRDNAKKEFETRTKDARREFEEFRDDARQAKKDFDQKKKKTMRDIEEFKDDVKREVNEFASDVVKF